MESHNLSPILPSKECVTFVGRIIFTSYVIMSETFEVNKCFR
jgi:hypothetical protein